MKMKLNDKVLFKSENDLHFREGEIVMINQESGEVKIQTVNLGLISQHTFFYKDVIIVPNDWFYRGLIDTYANSIDLLFGHYEKYIAPEKEDLPNIQGKY